MRTSEALTAGPQAADRAPAVAPPATARLLAGRMTPADVLRLQRSTGNAAVVRLLQRQAAESGPCCEACAEGEACEQQDSSSAVVGIADASEPPAAADHLTSPRFAGDQVLEACYEDRARLGVGDRGAPVVAVQQALIDLGYDLGSWGADGSYGQATAAAVRAFKRDEELGFEQYGDVGPGTMHRLDYLFPPPDGAPLCRGDMPDIPILASQQSDTEQASGGPMLSFAIPGVFCQLKAPIQRFTDIPADVRGKLQVSIGHGGAGLQQKVIDEAYTPYTGRYQKQPKDPAPKETPPTIFGDGIPSTPVVRESLRRLVFTITGSSASPLTPGTTTNINVGLVRDIDGNDMLGGVFRFTYFQVGKTPATVLIEHLGAGRQPPANYLADASKENFELAWKPRNFKLDGPGWELKERIGQLQWALVNAPQKALFTMFRDITFKYTAKPPGIKEDGLWDPATKTLTLFYGVFDSDAQRIGKMPYYAYVIVHELGHALESTFDTAGQAEFNAALKKDGGTPVTDYGRRNERESFAEAFAIFVMDQDQLTALRPSVADVFWKRYVR